MTFKERYQELLLDMVGNWFCEESETRRHFIYIYRAIGLKKFEISSFDVGTDRYSPGFQECKLGSAKFTVDAAGIICGYHIIQDEPEIIDDLNAILAELLLIQ